MKTLNLAAVATAILFACSSHIGCVAYETASSEDLLSEDPSAFGPCVPIDACEVAVLDENGVCVRTKIPGCALCVAENGIAGTTRDGGACCSSCWAGQTCYPSPDAMACGAAGGLCAPCLSGSMRCSPTGECAW